MADFPTQNELFNIGRDEALARNGALSKAAFDRDGADANIVLAAASAMADEVVAQLTRVEAATYLDSAEREALDRLVFDRYGLLRRAAAPAVGTVQFTTGTASPSTFAIPVGTKLAAADGRQYVTTASATFTAGSTGPVLVAVRSVLAGADQQAAPGVIASVQSTITGAPNNLAVSNVLATAGAADRELDDSLRARARAFWTNAQRGTIGAIQNAALAVPGVQTATATEVLDAFGRPARAVQLVVADAFAPQLVNVTPVPATYAAQSQALAAAVSAALYDVRAGGVQVQVQVGVTVLVPVTLALRFAAGADVDAVALAARATVVGVINASPPGAGLDPTTLVNALRTVRGLVVTGDEILSPAGVLAVRPVQVLRTTLALVLAASTQPEFALQNTTNADA